VGVKTNNKAVGNNVLGREVKLLGRELNMHSKMALGINHYHIIYLLSNKSERALRDKQNLANKRS